MPLPWPEIRDKAIAFSREWQDGESERAEAQTFWNEFFAVCRTQNFLYIQPSAFDLQAQ